MWGILLFFAIIQAVHCSCPNGFELVRNGECRGKYASTYYSWSEASSKAVTKCKEVQGKPIIIHDSEHTTYWSSKAGGYGLPMGLVCNTSSHRWEWSDGSPVDYKPPGQDSKDLDASCRSDCSWYLQSSGKWEKECGSNGVTFNIYCTTQLSDPVNVGGCELFDDDSEDGVCYQVETTAKDWKDAQMICRKAGANLASIHNLQENSFIRRLATSKGAVNGVFIGAAMSGKGGNFGWIDGSKWDYENFATGFPRTGFGDCIAMDTSSTKGEWMNIDCSEELPVVCIRDPRPIVAPACSSEIFEEDTIITSPGFPFTASTPCDYILSVESGKKIELEIVLLEANTCCDTLIVYDGYMGGHEIAKLSGELHNATYTTTTHNSMRVSWQPKGGNNVRGVAMAYRAV